MIRLHTCVAFCCFLVLLAAPAAAQQSAGAPPESHLFQVLLLQADLRGESDVADVPENVQHALDDIREFLPYRSYRMVDAAILRSDRDARGALNGPAGEKYQVGFQFEPARDDAERLHVSSFVFVERPVPPTVASPPSRGGGSAPAPAAAPEAPKTIIQTSFSVQVGETIVVGSSKLNGTGSALLVLLTAIP